MKAIERIYQYIDYKGLKPIPFEKQIGLSNGYLSKQLKRNADLGEGILMKIIENCPEINPIWLLTGEGQMLKTKNTENVTEENSNKNSNIFSNKRNVQKMLPNEMGKKEIGRPFSDLPIEEKLNILYIQNIEKHTLLEKINTLEEKINDLASIANNNLHIIQDKIIASNFSTNKLLELVLLRSAGINKAKIEQEIKELGLINTEKSIQK